MRSRSSGALLAKDARELLASRAAWVLLLAVALLVGHAFLDGVEAYAEMSGVGGGPAALAQGLSPLDGIVVPTFGTLALASMLLLPFVVIRLVAHERQNGAWTLLVQGPLRIGDLLASKVLVLVATWIIAATPALAALGLWRLAGNHLDAGECLAVILGQFLFAWISIGVATAAAAVMDGEANAAIVALGFTIGSWALEFVGAVRGGLLALLASFTPGAMLRSFEQGLVRSAAVAVAATLGATGIAIAAVWLARDTRPARRWAASAGIVAMAAVICLTAAQLRPSWDLSEDHRNSFAPADAATLRTLRGPLRIEIHLAPEDPRLEDFRRGVLDKLQRLLPDAQVQYVARTRTGLFEQADSLYGTITYQVGARRAVSRSVTVPIVLEQIYDVAGITAPAATPESYPGFPLSRRPAGIIPTFFIVWPLILLAVLGITRRNRRSTPS